MRRVVLESPYAGDVVANIRYARRALRDALERGEAPTVSHLLYTQVLDDDCPLERDMAMFAGHQWIKCAHALVVYQDLGISRGMREGINFATALQIPIEYRSIDE